MALLTIEALQALGQGLDLKTFVSFFRRLEPQFTSEEMSAGRAANGWSSCLAARPGPNDGAYLSFFNGFTGNMVRLFETALATALPAGGPLNAAPLDAIFPVLLSLCDVFNAIFTIFIVRSISLSTEVRIIIAIREARRLTLCSISSDRPM